MKQALLIFTKNLIYGKVKTRLAATVGSDKALSVYQQLIQHTVAITHYLPVEKFVFYSDYMEEQDVWNAEVYKKQLQRGSDLGERMCLAFAHAFNAGNERAVIIGTDCMEISSAIIMNAFVYLNQYDIAIGPAKDGGYYLLAMKQLHYQLFKSIGWSTDEVLAQTLAICERLNLSVFLLPELSDIDDEKDLIKLQGHLQIKES